MFTGRNAKETLSTETKQALNKEALSTSESLMDSGRSKDSLTAKNPLSSGGSQGDQAKARKKATPPKYHIYQPNDKQIVTVRESKSSLNSKDVKENPTQEMKDKKEIIMTPRTQETNGRKFEANRLWAILVVGVRGVASKFCERKESKEPDRGREAMKVVAREAREEEEKQGAK